MVYLFLKNNVSTPMDKKLKRYFKTHQKTVKKIGNDVDVRITSGMVVKIFCTQKMKEIKESVKSGRNLSTNIGRILNLVGDSDGYLPLALIQDNALSDIDNLQERFPNFSRFFDHLKQDIALSMLSETRPVLLSNYLLNGPPGIGKTAVCQDVANALATPFKLISLSSMTAGFILSGNSSSWSEGKHGVVIELLAYGKKANSTIVYDEIDKVGGDLRYNPYGVLLQLLEPETSRRFIDESIEVETDCSYINNFATSNYIRNIPEPVLSRFVEIEIDKPTDSQMPLIIGSIYRSVLEDHHWGKRFTSTLNQQVIEKLISIRAEPRLMKQILKQACGKQALKNCEKQTEKALSITADDIVTQPKKPPISTKNNERYYAIMPIHAISSVDKEPKVDITLWSIKEIKFGSETERTRHIVGYIPSQDEGRVSSAIMLFERDTMTVRTQSNRLYHLIGPPGEHPDADYVWDHWKQFNEAIDEIDVTHCYCVAH